jgi:hypothetical protein
MRANRRSKFNELVQWFPAIALFLYTLGYVAANSHYGRFELVKATLLNARYLAAGLLYTTLVAVPAIVGFMFMETVAVRKSTSQRAYRIALFLVLTIVIGFTLAFEVLVRNAPWKVMVSPFLAFALGLIAQPASRNRAPQGSDPVAHTVQLSHESYLALLRLYRFTMYGILFLITAYAFGRKVYPWIKPHYGGAAVSMGFVSIKSDGPTELEQVLSRGPVPLFDIDEKFLYVVSCQPHSSNSRPRVMMIPLEFLSNVTLGAGSDTLVAVPTYVDEHRCSSRNNVDIDHSH